MTAPRALVQFTTGDEYGLWEAGEIAAYLGRESDNPEAPNIHLFRTARGETLALTDPFYRGIVRYVHLPV